jgi:thymidylate synthase (FAD)
MEDCIDERKVLNAGLCALVSVNGDDARIAQRARTSFRNNQKETSELNDANLIDYIMRHHHDTPFEFCGAEFYMVMPIFVARQMVRHRTAAINEESLRYVEARDECWVPSPEECKTQSVVNKQGSSSDLVKNPNDIIRTIESANTGAKESYNYLLEKGLSKELARSVLPLGQYTAWYWTANLRNIFHLLNLRMDEHAQYQIRVYANAMYEMLRPHFPVACSAFDNHVLNAITFSADEWNSLKFGFDMVNCQIEREALKHANILNMRKTRVKEFADKLGEKWSE